MTPLRRCPDCGETKPQTTEHFYRYKTNGKSKAELRWDHPCKQCRLARTMETHRRRWAREEAGEPGKPGRPAVNKPEFGFSMDKLTRLERAWRGWL